jgi:hypothetical protein
MKHAIKIMLPVIVNGNGKMDEILNDAVSVP